MSDQFLISALENSSPPVAKELLEDVRKFLSILDAVSQSILEEAVPAEMMQVFTDEQWTNLIFELQPGATLFTSIYDVATLHQSWIKTGAIHLPVAGNSLCWLIYSDLEGLVVRLLNPQEFQALEMAGNSQSFLEIASALWPDLDDELAQHEMTQMLLGWLEDGLIIDAGVPLPDDAEFEKEPDIV